jgi:hypothetical protein
MTVKILGFHNQLYTSYIRYYKLFCLGRLLQPSFGWQTVFVSRSSTPIFVHLEVSVPFCICICNLVFL